MTSSLLLSLIGYFLLAAAAAGLLLFADFRESLLVALKHGALRLQQRLGRWRLRTGRSLTSGWGESRLGGLAVVALARQHALAIGAALLLLTLPVLLALLMRRAQPLEGFEDLGRDSDPIVASLLDGEALVPPPPLPPEVFVTREVEALRPDLGSASREWALLDAELRQRLLNVYKVMAAQGYTMALLEGYRSPQRQAMLQAQGNTVTNAGAYQSYHQFGLAADSAFFRDGKLVISEKDPWAMRGYALYGQAAQTQGLRWGGDWRLQDYGHVELKRAGVIGKR